MSNILSKGCEFEMQDITLKIDALSDKINLINQNVQFNVTVIWTMIGILVTVAGIVLYNLAQKWVEKAVNKKINAIKLELKDELSKENDKNISLQSEKIKDEIYFHLKTDLELELIGYIDRTKHIYWASGSGIQVVENNGQHILNIYGLSMTNECDKTIINIEIRSLLNGRKINCDYTTNLKRNETVPFIRLIDYDKSKDGEMVVWKVIWVNGDI